MFIVREVQFQKPSLVCFSQENRYIYMCKDTFTNTETNTVFDQSDKSRAVQLHRARLHLILLSR